MGLEIDFLAVGEASRSGDAIALRYGDLKDGQQTVVVVDGGMKESGEALLDHINKYYGTDRIDFVVSTHPDADHASGLEVVLEKGRVGNLLMHLPWEHTDDINRMFKDGRVTDTSVSEALRKSLDNARRLEQIARAKGIPITEPFAGLSDSTGCLRIVGPTQEYYESLLPGFRGTPEPKRSMGFLEKGVEFLRKIAENWNIETLDDSGETSSENNASTVLLLSVDGRSSLLTGDAGIPALTHVADRLESTDFDRSTLRFVQVPHHGSRRNVGPTILDRLIGPKQSEDKQLRSAFVSVAKEGAPKHPAKKVTNSFRRRRAYVYRTNGGTIWHHYDAPERSGFSPVDPLPFYDEVDE